MACHNATPTVVHQLKCLSGESGRLLGLTRCTGAVAVPAGLALKRALGSIDVRLIDPGEISICKREDGSDWLLGAGSFGKVMAGVASIPSPPAKCHESAAADLQSEPTQAGLSIVVIRGCAVRRVLSCSTLLLSGIQGLVEREGSRRQAAGELLTMRRRSFLCVSLLGSLAALQAHLPPRQAVTLPVLAHW